MPGHPDLAVLRARIATLEHAGGKAFPLVAPLGIASIDQTLQGGGLRLGCLHEVEALDKGPASGFVAALAGRLGQSQRKQILWCRPRQSTFESGELYEPGLSAFGLTPDRIIVARTRTAQETLWVMEEGGRCPGLAAIIGELDSVPMIAGRRLQLAAETTGVTGFALTRVQKVRQPSAAVSMWRVGTSTSPVGDGLGLWRLDLLRCRSGGVGTWEVEWNDETHSFALVSSSGDGSDRAIAPRVPGSVVGDTRREGRAPYRSYG
jgi:protein ImuA